MNTKQAKAIQLIDVLDRLGHKPVKKERGGRELKYRSPLRIEEMASFNLSLEKNCFYDFGLSEGGNTLDFAIEYLKSRGQGASVSEALAFLDNLMGGPGLSQKRAGDLFEKFQNKKPSNDDTRDLQFIRALPLTSRRVLEYLETQRDIPPAIAKKYLSLVQYQNKKKSRPANKPYFAFGMKNLDGGWEIRSATDSPAFKSALISRNISVIKGSQSGDTALIFEGMLDMISLVILKNWGIKDPPVDCIVMHSLSSYNSTIEYVKQNGYSNLLLCLDNDNAGNKCTDKFKSEFAERVRDMRKLYPHHKDLNKALRASNRRKVNGPDLRFDFSFSQ